MKRTNLVQPHHSLKTIWHCFFGIGFNEPRIKEKSWWDFYDFYLLSFVTTPADLLGRKEIINEKKD